MIQQDIPVKQEFAGSASTQLCIACGGGITLFCSLEGFEYHICEGCGTLQLNPMPTKDELNRAYAEEYAKSGHMPVDTAFSIRSSQPYYDAILRVVMNYKVKGRILDYGAGLGGLCMTLMESGFDVTGVDLSKEYVEDCQKRGIPVSLGDLNQMTKREAFSAVVMCQVFEHMVEHDESLSLMRRVMVPGGILISHQPTASISTLAGKLSRRGKKKAIPRLPFGMEPPWHTVLFSFSGMKALAERNGFDLIEIRPSPTGRRGGLIGAMQRILAISNLLGVAAFGYRFPLVAGHIFVMRTK